MSLLLNRYVIGAIITAGLIVAVMLYGHRRYAAGVADTRIDYTRIAQEQVEFNQAHAQAESDRLRQVIEHYETQLATPDPVVVSLGQRLHHYTLSTCPLSAGEQNPGPVSPSAAESGSDRGIRQATQSVFDACHADAEQVIALQKAWPQ